MRFTVKSRRGIYGFLICKKLLSSRIGIEENVDLPPVFLPIADSELKPSLKKEPRTKGCDNDAKPCPIGRLRIICGVCGYTSVGFASWMTKRVANGRLRRKVE